MVPVLDSRNRETGRFRKTLADSLLPKYDEDLAVIVVDEHGEEMLVPVWRFIERYLRVKDKRGRYCVFEINRAQCDLYSKICERKRRGLGLRFDILKARQLGFSTFIAALFFTLTALVPNQTCVIVADVADHATNLFRKYKFFYANLPDYLKGKLPTLASNAKELIIDYGMGQTSVIRVTVQGESAGRSDTCQYVHLSEVAFWQDIVDTSTSILNTVDDTNPDSIVFYETTANGVNEYKEMWDQDVISGDDGFAALFYPWYEDPNYAASYWGFELFDWEKKLQSELGLSLEQIAWYRVQFNKMRSNLPKLRQEMPSTPVEAFITSGSSVFNMELLLERKAEIMRLPKPRRGFFQFRKQVSQDGGAIDVSGDRFVESEAGPTLIYEEPKPGHPYVVNNDPAMGGEDYFATVVVDNSNGRQVATFHKNKCDADEAAYQTLMLARYYNGALLSGETNTTSYLLKLARKCGYRFIYQDSDAETLGVRYQDKLGYKTKQNNRQLMIEMFAEAFRDDPTIVSDYATICEMESFQVVRNDSTGKEKAQATGGKHDDLVMAMCGFYLCRGSQMATVSKAEASPTQNIEELEARLDEMARNKKEQRRNVIQIWD